MAPVFDRVRRITRFLLAAFLWLHALFLFTPASSLVSQAARLLHLTASEVLLFGLLVVVSFLTASGFWNTVGSVAYIYGFPFVLLGKVLYRFGLGARALNTWFKSRQRSPLEKSLVVENTPSIVPARAKGQDRRSWSSQTAGEILQFLLRPFGRFMLLWWILLLVTTHVQVVWLCLIVVLAQLARQIFIAVKLLFFSPWLSEALRKIGPAMLTPVNDLLVSLAGVTRDALPDSELKKLWGQLHLWKSILNFLRDPYLLSRWAWVLGILVFLGVYLYIAILFSFVYYGIARVNGLSYSWPDALVTSLFIPFFVSDLPKILTLKLLGGFHCGLVLGVGVTTFFKFLHRKMEAIRSAATNVSERFTEPAIQEKFVILGEIISPPAPK